jgi:hypothetical protein
MEIGPARPHLVICRCGGDQEYVGKSRPCWPVIQPGKILSASWNSMLPFVPATFSRLGRLICTRDMDKKSLQRFD